MGRPQGNCEGRQVGKRQEVTIEASEKSGAFLFCKNSPKTASPTDQQPGETVELPADFVKFYEEFHKDSVFQLAHIQFPLPEREAEKMPDGSYSLQLNWTKADWKIQSLPPLNTGEFHRDFIPLGPEMMIEKITTGEEVGFSVERRFAKLGGEWMLIFYSAGMARQ